MNALARKHVNAWMCAPRESPRTDSFPVYAGTTQDYHLGSILITRLSRRAQENAKSRLSDPHSLSDETDLQKMLQDITIFVSHNNVSCLAYFFFIFTALEKRIF